MQKKLIAVAVAGLMSGAAFAQSNVTVYGVADLTWEQIKSSGSRTTPATNDIESRTRLASNSSLIGFKGAETLGNGLTAVFQFEGGVTADSGFSTISARDTLIGLAGGFGTVAAGNLSGPVRAIGAKVDFNPGASSAGFTGLYGEIAGLHTGVDDRSPNAIAYISPNLGGATIIGAYQNGTTTSDASTVKKDSHLYTLGVTYAVGPIWVGAGYINAKNPTVANVVGKQALLGSTTATDAAVDAVLPAGTAAALTAANDSLKNFRVGAVLSLDTGTSISALYDTQKYVADNATTGANITEAKRNAFMVGVKQAFGANAVFAQYAVAKDLTGNVCNLYTATAQSCGETAAKQFTVGYSYDLSKRTMVHAFYSKVTNEKDTNYDHYVNPVGNAKGADSTVIGAGLRHTF